MISRGVDSETRACATDSGEWSAMSQYREVREKVDWVIGHTVFY